MAAPELVKDIPVDIVGESTSGSDVVVVLPAFVPTGHIAFVTFELGSLQNSHDYSSTGESAAHQSVWIVARNNTGSASSDGVTLGDASEVISSAGTPMIPVVSLEADTGNLSIGVVVTETDTLAVLASARVRLYSWPNTVTS